MLVDDTKLHASLHRQTLDMMNINDTQRLQVTRLPNMGKGPTIYFKGKSKHEQAKGGKCNGGKGGKAGKEGKGANASDDDGADFADSDEAEEFYYGYSRAQKGKGKCKRGPY